MLGGVPMIRGVTFDFGGTLAQGAFDRETFRNRFLDYLLSLDFSGGEDQLNKAKDRMLERLGRARSRNREIRLEDLYQDVLFELGLRPERDVIGRINQLYMDSFQTKIIEGVEEILKDLSERYKLAVISNAMSDVPRYALKKFGLERYFVAVVISRDLGIRKPDPEIFNFTLNRLDVENVEAIHVGDSLEHDIKGARNAGMKTVWVKNDNQVPDIEPDYTIHSITELTSFL